MPSLICRIEKHLRNRRNCLFRSLVWSTCYHSELLTLWLKEKIALYDQEVHDDWVSYWDHSLSCIDVIFLQTTAPKQGDQFQNIQFYFSTTGNTPKKKPGRPKKLKQEKITDHVTVKKKRKIDRFKGMSEEEVLTRLLPDHLAPNLDIVIVSYQCLVKHTLEKGLILWTRRTYVVTFWFVFYLSEI